MFRKQLVFVACLLACAAGAWGWAEDFGPEWTKVGTEWQRKIGVLGYGGMSVRKHKDGTAAEFEVTLGEIIHYDLNGDGFFDGFSDRRGHDHKSYILFEGRIIVVHGESRGSIKGGGAYSPDNSIRYVFKEGSWMVDGAKRVRPGPNVDNALNPGLETIQTQWRSAGNVHGFAIGRLKEFEATKDAQTASIRRWEKVISPPEFVNNSEHFAYLNLIQPQPESAFTVFKDERLSSELVTDSKFWMDNFFRPGVNPYENILAVVVPDSPRIGAKEQTLSSVPLAILEDRIDSAEVEGRNQMEIKHRIKQVQAALPHVNRARPTKYYLAPKDGLSLLRYEYDVPGMHVQITESSAALLVRLRPEGRFNVRSGIVKAEADRLLTSVFDAGFVREKLEFSLPRVLRTGQTFLSGHKAFADYVETPELGLPHWTADVIGVVSDKDICLIVRKSMGSGAGSMSGLTHYAYPHPDWLRRDLYESDGVTLVIDRREQGTVMPKARK